MSLAQLGATWTCVWLDCAHSEHTLIEEAFGAVGVSRALAVAIPLSTCCNGQHDHDTIEGGESKPSQSLDVDFCSAS